MATKAQRQLEHEALSPFCRRDCKVCTSGHVLEIHGLIEAGRKYTEVVAEMKRLYRFSVSPAAISRHMANYKESVVKKASQQIAEAYDAAADRQAIHQMQAAVLADLLFQNLKAQIEARVYVPSVSDWEKAVKLFHAVKAGDTGAMDGLIGIFQAAASKHGFSMSQGVLFNQNPGQPGE